MDRALAKGRSSKKYMGVSHNQILYLENFVDKSDTALLLSSISESPLWTPHYYGGNNDHPNYSMHEPGYQTAETAEANAFAAINQWFLKAADSISSFYGDDFLVGRPGIKKWLPGRG